MKISAKKSVIIILIVFIMLTGIFTRLGSVGLEGIPLSEKNYYKDSNGQNYMYDMDSYYNYRLSENLLEKGHLYQSIYKNQTWDSLSYYPPGVPFDYPPLISYLSVFFYKLVNYFYPISLLTICFWLPLVIGPLSGVVAFLFVYRLKKNYEGILGGIVAGLLIVLSPFYFMRTVPGFFDTDMFIILFSLLTVWLLFESIQASSGKKQIILTVCASLSMLMFSFAWTGWQLLFIIISASTFVYVAFLLIKNWKIKKILNSQNKKLENRNFKGQNSYKLTDVLQKEKSANIRSIILIFGFLFISLFLILLLKGPEDIIKIIQGPLTAFKLSSNQLWGSWPDPYNTITELEPPSILNLFMGIGPGLLILGIFGLILIIYQFMISFIEDSKLLNGVKLKYKISRLQIKEFLAILLFIWILAGFLSLLKGIRFELMLIGPLSITAGVAFIELSNYLQKFIHNPNYSKNYRNLILVSMNIILIFIVVSPSLIIVESNYQNLIPRANDDLYASAVWIGNNTPNNTVIISDWVHGHFFAAISNRPVNFDGRLGYIETIQDRSWVYKDSDMDTRVPNIYRQYWQNKALATSNITLSQGILRMISTSGDQAYLLLEDYTHNQSLSEKILEDILGRNKSDSLTVLDEKYHINNSTALKVVNYTHPTHSSPYILVTSDEFIENGYWIFFYGTWDFNKKQSNNYPYSFGNIIEKNENSIKTDDGTLIDLQRRSSNNNNNNKNSSLNASWDNLTPYKLVIIKNHTSVSSIINKSSDFNIYFLPEKNKTVVLNKNYENSVFVKLILENKDYGGFKLTYNKGTVYLWENINL